jgi:hypothetical protein
MLIDVANERLREPLRLFSTPMRRVGARGSLTFVARVPKTAPMRKRVSWWSTLCGLSVGVGSGVLADVLISRRMADRRVLWAAVGLVAAALVYPMARCRPGLDRSEAWTVLSACAIAAMSVGFPERSARSLLGVGWMSHALFDLAFGHGSSTWRLPRWYPALCAGFDVAYGAQLLRSSTRPKTSAA